MVIKLSDCQWEYLGRYPPGDAVGWALSKLLANDDYLLNIDANERSITFRFAMYLQQQLPDRTVDCEFNRDGVDPKRIMHLKLNPDSEDTEAKTVFPDVIVHRRGRCTENYLVVEFKKSTSRVDRQIDLQKLRDYKQQFRYEHALFVEVGTGGQARVAALKWVG
jgi:hypothetical protein